MSAKHTQIRRLTLHELPPLTDLGPNDYLDAFLLTGGAVGDRTAEELVRSAFQSAPAPLRGLVRIAHRRVLRLQLGSPGSPDHVIGWRIVETTPDTLRIEAESPLLTGVIIVRRVADDSASLVTALRYKRPVAMRTLWTVLGPIHRRVARYLLRLGADAA